MINTLCNICFHLILWKIVWYVEATCMNVLPEKRTLASDWVAPFSIFEPIYQVDIYLSYYVTLLPYFLYLQNLGY
jgi:hypothetical protein